MRFAVVTCALQVRSNFVGESVVLVEVTKPCTGLAVKMRLTDS